MTSTAWTVGCRVTWDTPAGPAEGTIDQTWLIGGGWTLIRVAPATGGAPALWVAAPEGHTEDAVALARRVLSGHRLCMAVTLAERLLAQTVVALAEAAEAPATPVPEAA